jgi:flagellar hook-associated protein 2
MVNVGTNAAPDYRLSIQNGELANTAIQLAADDGTNPGISLLTAQAPGAAATYRVNGVPASPSALSSNSPVITLAIGVAVTLLAPGTSTVTVSQNTAAVSSALSGFVNAYNAVLSEINHNRGKDAGALQGQSILMSLRESLGRVADYSTGYQGLSSLTSLGLAFDSAGVLSFDAKAFDSATGGQMQPLASFLGSTTGGGFLKAANDALAGVTNATGGLIAAQMAAVESQITNDNQIISAQTEKVSALQTRLTEQMARADAAISAMEQQYSYLAQMFQQMQINARNLG